MFHKILKYNPNHDPGNGQFTSADGVAGFPATPGDQASRERPAITAPAGAAHDARAAEVQRLFDEFGVEATVPRALHQPQNTPDALYAQAHVAHAQMRELLDKGKGLTSQLGYRNMEVAPEHADMTEPGGMFFMGPIKRLERATEKVHSPDMGGDWSRLTDITRSTIAVDSLQDVKQVLAKLKASGITVVRAKNRFVSPAPGGYRDILMNVKMPNGHIGELQIHLKPLLDAKGRGGGHHLYDQMRKIGEKYPSDTPLSRYTTRDRRAYVKLMAQSEMLYNAAWSRVHK